mmetsp:Transcript_124045/g.322229  ORF Transcript_124045/g.322229 Transcript_124045/m.322229 type:complete len:205 (-) Transcript_124045:953-1567(-)
MTYHDCGNYTTCGPNSHPVNVSCHPRCGLLFRPTAEGSTSTVSPENSRRLAEEHEFLVGLPLPHALPKLDLRAHFCLAVSQSQKHGCIRSPMNLRTGSLGGCCTAHLMGMGCSRRAQSHNSGTRCSCHRPSNPIPPCNTSGPTCRGGCARGGIRRGQAPRQLRPPCSMPGKRPLRCGTASLARPCTRPSCKRPRRASGSRSPSG